MSTHMWKSVEECGRIWKDGEGYERMWKNVEDYGIWGSDLESSIVVLYILVYSRM